MGLAMGGLKCLRLQELFVVTLSPPLPGSSLRRHVPPAMLEPLLSVPPPLQFSLSLAELSLEDKRILSPSLEGEGTFKG